MHLTDPSVFFHLRTLKASPAPFLVTVRVGLPETALPADGVLAQALRQASCVTANSNATLADILRHAPDVASRSSVIYNGLPVPTLAIRPPDFRASTLLCLGWVVHDKGFDIAVEAFAGLHRRHPQARLVIVGDGPALPALEAQARTLHLGDRVEFRGWVAPDRVPAILNDATVVLVPSRRRESFGLVALEAALAARPVVASRTGGLPEVVVHDRTGLLVEKEDAAALGEAAARLLDDPGRAVAMGREARLRAIELFGFERHVDAYNALYHRLVGCGGWSST